MKEQYLGDGLYASFDGYHIWLRAPREGGDHIVGLEPAVWNALVNFHNSLTKKESTP
jgi:hypothetical protein